MTALTYILKQIMALNLYIYQYIHIFRETSMYNIAIVINYLQLVYIKTDHEKNKENAITIPINCGTGKER